jgi:UDP-N-acetylmuramate--alanine ligase
MKFLLSDLSGKRVHLVGVGGAGMSGIARIMASHGISVSGSDAKDSSVLAGLRAIGIKTFVGHNAEQAEGVEFLVYSSAISPSNPEMLQGVAMGIPLLSRAQALAILMSESKSVAVAGTHGKTTTTSMLTVALQNCGEDPSFAIGGVLKSSGANAHKGNGEFFIAEADESDGSFVEYHPYGAIITNIEHDHVDHFATPELVHEAFEDFSATISTDGFLVYCEDDAGSASLGATINHCTTISYGVSIDADLRLDEIELGPSRSQARVLWKGRSLGKLEALVPGHHNLLNSAAALSAGLLLGMPTVELLEGLAMFRGTGRRFELKGQVHGIRVIDDYGHHPTEIEATLRTARRFASDGRVLVIFQPHRYSRTKAFASGFARTLDLADQSWILEVYGASEKPIPGVGGQTITHTMKSGKFEPNFLTAIEEITAIAKAGDVIITLGAGDVSSLAPVIVDSLMKKYPEIK